MRLSPSHITNLALFIKPAPLPICDLSFPVPMASLRCQHEFPFRLALGPRVKRHLSILRLLGMRSRWGLQEDSTWTCGALTFTTQYCWGQNEHPRRHFDMAHPKLVNEPEKERTPGRLWEAVSPTGKGFALGSKEKSARK